MTPTINRKGNAVLFHRRILRTRTHSHSQQQQQQQPSSLPSFIHSFIHPFPGYRLFDYSFSAATPWKSGKRSIPKPRYSTTKEAAAVTHSLNSISMYCTLSFNRFTIYYLGASTLQKYCNNYVYSMLLSGMQCE